MNKIFKNKNGGITVVELLISISILALILAVVLPQFSRMRSNQVLKNATIDIMSALHKAQSQTLASLNSSEYGVRFESDQVVIFSGTTFSAIAPDNEYINITGPATISNVTLNGSSGTAGDLYFTRLSGTPSKTGTISVYTPNLSKIITISDSGAISLN